MMFSSSGKAIRFNEKDVRPMGRTAAGVRGIKMAKDHLVKALIILERDALLLATENGFGKRTLASEFSVQGRGGQGVIAIQASKRNGALVGALQVDEDDEAMLITMGGTLVRTPVTDVSLLGRNTQGVTLIRLGDDDKLVGLESIVALGDEDDDDNDDDSADGSDAGADSDNDETV